MRLKIAGIWTWDEFAEARQAMYVDIDAVDKPVGMLVYLIPPFQPPPLSIRYGQQMIRNRHPRIAITVFVEAPRLFKTMWRTIGRVYNFDKAKRPFMLIDDERQAVVYIKQVLTQ